MTRRARIFAAVCTAAALLFAQLAVSAYACPRAGEVTASPATMSDEAPSADSNLCEQHCQDGKASTQTAKPSVAAPDFLLGPPLKVLTFDVMVRAGRSAGSPRDIVSKPPPLHRYTVLRI